MYMTVRAVIGFLRLRQDYNAFPKYCQYVFLKKEIFVYYAYYGIPALVILPANSRETPHKEFCEYELSAL